MAIAVSRRRARGIYYTPADLSQAMVEWAIRDRADKVLEPSFGGCVFLKSAVSHLSGLGCATPLDQIFGFDIDRSAFEALGNCFQSIPDKSHFQRIDFLKASKAKHRLPLVDVVVGNPPYISNHNMTKAQRQSVYASSALAPLSVRRTASLWAHFVNHSLTFLKPNSRLAFVLPAAAFQSDYGEDLLSQLTQRFRMTQVISIRERLFSVQGIQERSTVLLCEGYELEPTTQHRLIRQNANSMADSIRLIASAPSTNVDQSAIETATESALSVFRRVGGQTLGELAQIKIGVVTGANAFFALKESDVQRLGLSDHHVSPFLSRASIVDGLNLRARDMNFARQNDERCLLLSPLKNEDDRMLKAYLRTFEKQAREKNKTFKKRVCWYKPLEGSIPDAFLSYMNAATARLILNDAKVQCLNNIHRVYFRDGTSKQSQRFVSIFVFSSFGQLAIELLGRAYGGGVLKLEPSDAKRIPIPHLSTKSQAQIASVWAKINSLLRTKDFNAAIRAADDFVSRVVSDREANDILGVCRNALHRLRARWRLGEARLRTESHKVLSQ
jgi:adenine-specific DNA-methyltransferase